MSSSAEQNRTAKTHSIIDRPFAKAGFLDQHDEEQLGTNSDPGILGLRIQYGADGN